MKLTFPHMGNTYIPVKAMLDDLGVNCIIPPFNNKKALEIGTKLAPELACLPLKINLGNFIQAYEMGADSILMTGGCGPCRFGYYCEMHREILSDMGVDMKVITLDIPGNDYNKLLNNVREITGGLNIYKILKAVKNTVEVSKKVDELERLTFKIRPREIHKGATDKIYRSFLYSILKIKGSRNIKKHIDKARNKLLEIQTDKEMKPIRVGIVGEIYTTNDPYSNLYIESRLGNEGIEVTRPVTVSGWIIDHMIKKALHLKGDERYKEAAKPYLGTMIGGHSQETIGNTVLFAKDGYDGVVQIFPLGCMPEIVSESILPSIERDFKIPVMSLIIDEMTGEAGYMTRVEAFIDLLKRRREIDAFEGKGMLSWN
ncbi:MAG TPA: CoA protein activase [Pseudobacteroides sp.]|uniref:CoA protein activase n=1 Tax=Pseudobacteroides sp. TaxID=1968840 RepID=UPI002F91D3A6